MRKKWKRLLRPRYILSTILLLLFLISLILFYSLRGMLDSQKAAERFRGDNSRRFAQISCFLPTGSSIDPFLLDTYEDTIRSRLTAAAVSPEQGEKLYSTAYSSRSTVVASSERGTFSLDAVGIGGDFFLFHPLRLRAGSYIDEDDLMDDRVVLDEEAAWKLFGALDIAGMSFQIGGETYYVAGVVERETDVATSKTFKREGGVFLFASRLSAPISTYEIAVAEAVTGFAEDMISKSFPVSDAHFVANSTRFSVGNLWHMITHFGERSVVTGSYDFPYWENAARMVEDWLALLLLLCILLPIFPFILFAIFAVRQCRRASTFVKQKWKNR